MMVRWFRTAGCAGIALLMAWSVARADDPFTVSDVHEDVTAASALAAKDQAQVDGQAKAFAILMGRVASDKAPHLSAAQITDLVIGFEVANERTSSVRYVADYTFHFNPAAVRRMLESASIAMVEPQAAPAKPMVVLPIFVSGGRANLWDDPNPWRDAWANRVSQSTVPIVVPVGDLPDVAAIDAPKATAGDAAALKAISSRYQNDDVLVVQGRFAGLGRFEIGATRYAADNSAPPRTLTLATTAKPGETEAQQLARSVDEVVSQLAQPVKTAATISSDTGGTIDVTLASASLGDWIAVRNRLREIPTVRGTELLSFDRNQIRVAIRYAGDQTQLRAVFGDHGLDLSGTDPDWTLTVHAQPVAAERPAAEPALAKPDAVKPPPVQVAPNDPLRKADE